MRVDPKDRGRTGTEEGHPNPSGPSIRLIASVFLERRTLLPGKQNVLQPHYLRGGGFAVRKTLVFQTPRGGRNRGADFDRLISMRYILLLFFGAFGVALLLLAYNRRQA